MNNQNPAIPINNPKAWTSVPDSSYPINQALLDGAKTLLKTIYKESGDADFLPGSYSDMNDSLTNYYIHANVNTWMYWMGQGNGLTWKCERTPGKEYSGTVTEVAPGATATQCFTDCSGFITGLFAYVNKVSGHSTEFGNWNVNEPVSEAGYLENANDTEYTYPNPSNYYRSIIQNSGFQAITLDNLEPGDLLVYANPPSKKDTGHIMLVAAIAGDPDDTNSKFVVVIDSTVDAHTKYDTRATSNGTVPGLGMGIVQLTQTDSGIDFYWSVGNAQPESGSVILGRAQ